MTKLLKGGSKMKLEEEFVGKREDFAKFLGKIAEQLAQDNLLVRGNKVRMPNLDMEYKINYKQELGENKLSIKIEWIELE